MFMVITYCFAQSYTVAEPSKTFLFPLERNESDRQICSY